MQPHSRKSVLSAAFVSFEVELVFESCDLKDANGRGHSLASSEKEEFEKRKARLRRRIAYPRKKEETPGRDDTHVPGQYHEQETTSRNVSGR
jgi:hypothetical protein